MYSAACAINILATFLQYIYFASRLFAIFYNSLLRFVACTLDVKEKKKLSALHHFWNKFIPKENIAAKFLPEYTYRASEYISARVRALCFILIY